MTLGGAKIAAARHRSPNPAGSASQQQESRARATRFRLMLLGRFELIGPNGPIDLGAGKLCGLLAILACTPAPQPRDKLMTLFWGSHFQAQARQNLRQALSRLRRALGDNVVRADEEEVALRPDAIVCDAERFEASIRDGSTAALDAAITLYQGAFLSTVAIKQEAWLEWVTAERSRLEGLAVRAMIRLGEEELKEGRAERALELANRAVAIDALLEEAHRLILRALATDGRRAEALKHYERLTALLRRELDVAPDPATNAVAAELRGASPAASRTIHADTESLPLPDRPSIAVLPFVNLSGDPEQDYFADGIVEDILAALSRVRWLFVIARQSSFSYRGRAVDVKRIGRELGVRYVVEGSIRSSGNRVRITAQLIDAETNAHIWADRYERDLSGIFALQDEITERIVTAVEPNVRAVEIKRALGKPTDSATAYDLYLRALHALHLQNEEGITRAEALLHRAIELDPDYAEVLGMLTDCITTRTLNGWHESVAGGAAEAAELARRALAAGPDNSTCVASAAFVYANLVGRYDEGLELAERAIRLHPNSVFVRNRAGAVYGTSGESDKAIMQFEAAQRMNPRDARSSTFTFTGISGAHLFARRFDDAIYWGRRALAVTPGANVARRNVAAALAHLGRLDEARAEIAELLRHQPNASLARSRLSRFRHEWMYELYLGGLRKAGLPEG